MTMLLADVRVGLKTRLETISGLRVSSKHPAMANVPAAMIRRVGSPSRDTFSGRAHHNFEILVLVQAVDIDRAQAVLDLYTDLSGTKSIRAALEADNTLGGAAEYIAVGDWDLDADVDYNDVQYLGAKLPVEVAVTY